MNYESSYSIFPPGRCGYPYLWSSLAQILPQIEGYNQFNAINFAFPSETSNAPYPANLTAESSVIASFLCPSDGTTIVATNFGATNYVACAGSGTLNNGNFNVVAGASLPDGVFWNTSNIRISGVTDGLSNTVGFSETILGNNISTPRKYVAAGPSPAVRAVQHIGDPADVPVLGIRVAEPDDPAMCDARPVGRRPGTRVVAGQLHHGLV